MHIRHTAAAAAAAIAVSAAGSASATVTQLTFVDACDSGEIHFDGLVPGTGSVDGLSATFLLTLSSVTDAGYRWNFSYELTNSSTVDSRLSVIGFDIAPDVASASDLAGLFTNSGSGNMLVLGLKDFCLKSNNGANCSGGAGGGPLDGASGSGAFSLSFADMIVGGTKKNPTYTPVAAPSSLVLDNFGVHYQSVAGYESAVGLPSAPLPPPETSVSVPEPQTWAMMILGFFGMGVVIRRRRAPARA